MDTGERVLRGSGDLGAGARAGLGLEGAAGGAEAPFAGQLSGATVGAAVRRGLEGYAALAEALRGWMRDDAVAQALPPEDAAWAECTYGQETYDEIGHKVAAFLRTGRTPDAVYYLDCLLLVTARMNLGKVLMLRAEGSPHIPAPEEFHSVLRGGEPALFQAWVRALRLEEWAAAVGRRRLETAVSGLLAAAEDLVRAGTASCADSRAASHATM